jgi:DNA-binding response OmpR family regulator
MRILVIEDEHKIANSIKTGLQQESYAVDVAYEGIQGFDLASTEDYDVIVLDLLLPGMDGLTICKKLRQESIHTPILMLTAKGQLARIKALTRRPKSTLGAVLKIGDLSLNTLNFQVKRADKEIKLSKKEFALLEYLLRHPNIVLPKEQIIAHVWDYDADILPNTVEVYIGYLRDKIDKPFKGKPSLIQTVRGFGYKIGLE